jgi:nitroreductase
MDNEILKAIRERRSIRRFREEQIKDEELQTVLEAGTWAPTGHGTQDPLIFAVQNPEISAKLRRLNAKAWKREDLDPYYGAPTIVLVFSKKSNSNCIKDGSLVIGNMLLAAHSLGLAACWINRCQEMFEQDGGAALRKQIGVPEDYYGVGCMALGYIGHAAPAPKPRKEDYYTILK